MQELSPDTKAIIAALRETRGLVSSKLDGMTTSQERLRDEIKELRKGFPDEDPESHRRYHESIIAWRELRNELVRGALLNASKVGFLAASGWVLYALWIVLKMEFLK